MPTSFWKKTHANRQLEYFEPFAGLTRGQSTLLRERLQRCSFPAGERFIRAGDPGDALYLIADGRVEVRRPDGQLLALLSKGHFVGEMALLNREPRVADCVAATKVRAWRLAWEDFGPLAAQIPELKLFLTRLVAHRLRWSGKDLLSRRIGNYEVVEQIGEGGMGWVFRAIQVPQETEVAVKMLPHTLVTRYGFLERFRAEAQILSRLRHENIIAVFDTIEAYGTMFIVMEFVRGLTAREWISAKNKPSPDQVRVIAAGVSAALLHAHKQGIVHRDIKPDNIMVRDDGCVKLMDFGIAQQLDRAGAEPGGFTPQYAAPEILRGEPVAGAADFYSLGITLYELLAGRPPFIGLTSDEWVRLHCESPPRPLRELAPQVPADLEAFVNAALIKEPHQRWTALQPLIAALTPRATPMTPPPRGKPASRTASLMVLWFRLPGEREERALLANHPLVVGRAERAHVRLADPCISARHCSLLLQPDAVHIRDLNSHNGTFLNDCRITAARFLVGDQLRIGQTALVLDSISRSGAHITLRDAGAEPPPEAAAKTQTFD
ncbi:MAG: protein kinase [Verrucomicrobia bacterium]|nr:protein kinase [Verrucomicrobiota bacterium]